jgi:hypothetical protein
MEYKTIRFKNIMDFDIQINKALEEGWQLYGNPFFADVFYVQCLIKEKTKNYGPIL